MIDRQTDWWMDWYIYDISSSLCPNLTLFVSTLSPVTIAPAMPIPQNSTLRLIANVNPNIAITKITWARPGGILMRSEKMRNNGTVAKLPQVSSSDSGAYLCMAHPRGNSSHTLFPFHVQVTIDGEAKCREEMGETLGNRIHLVLLLLMVWTGISARTSCSCITYLSIL